MLNAALRHELMECVLYLDIWYFDKAYLVLMCFLRADVSMKSIYVLITV